MLGLIPAKRFKDGRGALAPYAYVPTQTVTHRPENISQNEASRIAIVAVTTYDLVGKLEAGQRSFVDRGTTSGGIYVMQFVKPFGCEVQAGVSGKDAGSGGFGR